METLPPTDGKADIQTKHFVTATLPSNRESTELLLAGQASVTVEGDERGVTYLLPMGRRRSGKKILHAAVKQAIWRF